MSSLEVAGGELESELANRELEQRQLLLFAACSLLLATKLRQTPRLYIQTLVEFSKLELPIELSREEIVDGELLMLSMLKWDLAALVTPNEFLQELLTIKCHSVLDNFLGRNSGGVEKFSEGNSNDTNDKQDRQIDTATIQESRHQLQDHMGNYYKQRGNKLVNRVNRHTQTLLELCLMGE